MSSFGKGLLMVARGIWAIGAAVFTGTLVCTSVLVWGLEVPCLGIRDPERAAADAVEVRIAARESEARDRCEMTGGTATLCAAAIAPRRDSPVLVLRARQEDVAEFIVTTARGVRYAVDASPFERGLCSGMSVRAIDEPD